MGFGSFGLHSMGTKLRCLFYFRNLAVSIVMSFFFLNEPNQIPSENMTSQKAKLKADGLQFFM